MKLVVTHTSPDCDAVASLALAKLLHPGAVAALQGGVTPQLGPLLNLYRDELGLLDADALEPSQVAELVVVDTSDPARIAPFDALLGRVPVTLYDHHPRDEGSIQAARGLHLDIGATASLLTLLVQRQQLPLTPALASLALLGIHDDTGSLSYPSTRPEDHEAAAHLLRQGASLELVGQFLGERLGAQQRRLLTEMLGSAEVLDVAGRRVVLAELDSADFVPGLAPLCNQLLALYGADAAFIVARMEDKTLVVGRAQGAFDVGSALGAALGGGGHPGAGFARSDLPPEAARARLLAALPGSAPPLTRARDIMSSPVRTVLETTPVQDAATLLAQHGHTGLPVLDDTGRVVGVVTRRTLDKALRHDLGSAPVKAFMSAEVVSAPPETPLPDLEALAARHAVGRIPILEGGALLGIVTRTDLLRARHPQVAASQTGTARAEDILARLPSGALSALEAAQAEREQGRLYLVGGSLRDALLGVALQDLDLTLEGGDAPALASRLQRRLGGALSYHPDFGTSALTLPSGLVLDLAGARAEYYRHPGALPTVSAGTLLQDLARRDFTVNALALRLAPGPRLLTDPYGGLADLRAGLLRTLHPLSFVEDPTRILRGARLAARLGFRWEEATLSQMPAALRPEVLSRVSAARLRGELELTLAEPQPGRALRGLAAVGALAAMFDLSPDFALLDALDARGRQEAVPVESYLLALLLGAGPEGRARVLERFHWPRRLSAALERLSEARATGELTPDLYARLSEAEGQVLTALNPSLGAQLAALEGSRETRQIRGQDVLDLGLPAGPAVGRVLSAVARARRDARALTFDEELELARRLVQSEQTPTQEQE